MKRKTYWNAAYNEVRKARRKANPEKARAESRRSNWKHNKLDEPPYSAPDNCEACGKPFASMRKAPHYDHCHLTGLFRGWLCNNCNRALGLAGDSPEGVRRLLDYITAAYSKLHTRLETPT